MIERWTQYSEDIRWACNLIRAKRWRHDCSFSQRLRFDAALRPPIAGEAPAVAGYPDALYHVRTPDLLRAMAESGWPFYRPVRNLGSIR